MTFAGARQWLPAWLYTVGVLVVALQAPAQHPPAAAGKLTIAVVDENGVAVPQALVVLTGAQHSWRCGTDYSGRCSIDAVPTGTYPLHIEKLGFYRLNVPAVHIPETSSLDITLIHEQEVRETVDVVESPPVIDPQKTSDTQTLSQRVILNVPYPTTRDIRNALPLLPSVVMDQSGEIHVGGASRAQTLALLDGFDVSQPVTGFLEMRANADAVRTIDVEPGRYSVQYGRGDSVLGINTGIGDDRFRYTITNFIPSFQNRKGLHFNQFVPRATISGPIKRGRVWFYLAPEFEYSQEIIKELPEGQDRTTSWRTGNLAKIQANFTNANIFTAEFLVNNYHAPNAGLSAFVPLSSTVDAQGAAYAGSLKDQHYFPSGMLLELGFAANDFTGSLVPVSSTQFQFTPEGPKGSFFAETRGSARRLQWITNLYLPPRQWHGRHEFRVGGDLNRLDYHRSFRRAPVSIVRENGTLARTINFSDFARATDKNLQASLYAQDRWSPYDRLLIEGGVRTDWDEIIRAPVVAPRVSMSYMIDRNGNTKLSGGIGLFYLATNLEAISRPQTGQRADTFYAPDGVTPLGPPIPTHFFVFDDSLKQPRSLNWSIGLEQKLPGAVYLNASFLQKRVSNGFLYVPVGGPNQLVGDYLLTNGHQDHYYAASVTGRHIFHNVYPFVVSYTRSAARTNALFDYTVDNPTLGRQQSGPLPWDSPNRIIAWGWFPFIKKLDMGYSLAWQDGFPFTAVNQEFLVVGQANGLHFPRYFTLAVSAERRFQLHGHYLAIRITGENITGRENPNSVNNNVSSPAFMTFAGLGHRVITGRIRFLGSAKPHSEPPPKTTPEP